MRPNIKYLLLGCIISSFIWVIVVIVMMDSSQKNISNGELSDILNGKFPLDEEGQTSHKKAEYFDPDTLGMITNEKDVQIRNDGYKKFAFNVLVSDRLGYHRDVPDTRHEL